MHKDMEPYLMSKEGLKILKDPELFGKAMNEEQTLQEIMGWETETVLDMYDAAVRLAGNNRYEDASDAFFFLTTINPNIPSFWIGFGTCMKYLGKIDDAMMAYKMSIIFAPDYFPSYQRALQLAVDEGRTEEAGNILELMEAILSTEEGNPEFDELRTKSPTLQALVKQG